MYTFDPVKAADACVNWVGDWFETNGKSCNAFIGISGGKDSSVVASICTRAIGVKRVIGVLMPDGTQSDIEDSRTLVDFLGIDAMEADIAIATKAMRRMFGSCKISGLKYHNAPAMTIQSRENMPPRIRMATLYMLAQSMNGMVSNNSNLSERYIGYGTIFGDTAGDFAPIHNFTVSEVIQIGRVLGLPERLLVKPPSDGLSGKTDEDKIGFTYAVLDKYLRTGEIDDQRVKDIIVTMHRRNRFKTKPIASFSMEGLEVAV